MIGSFACFRRNTSENSRSPSILATSGRRRSPSGPRRGTRTSCSSRRHGRRLLGTVEVETAESVNNLEAMSQWAAFSRLRAPFHLYIPVSSVDTANRLCAGLQISVTEIWAYSSLGDQIRFTLVQRSAVGKARRLVASRPATRTKRPAARRLATSGRKVVGKRVGKRVGKKRVVRAPRVAKAARVTRKASKAPRLKKRK